MPYYFLSLYLNVQLQCKGGGNISIIQGLCEKSFSFMRKRILNYLEYMGITKCRFYKETGLSNGYLDKGSDIALDSYEKISLHYSDLNMEWVRTGEGPMLKSVQADVSVEEASEAEGFKPIPQVDGLLVADDEESFAKAVEHYGATLVPEYSTEFRGGDRGATLGREDLVGYWVIPNAPRGAFVITVYGKSMESQFESGSRLLLAPQSFDQNYPLSIPFGEVFGVILRDSLEDSVDVTFSAHIKILRRHPKKSSSVVCG